jgi:hypothetical protein
MPAESPTGGHAFLSGPVNTTFQDQFGVPFGFLFDEPAFEKYVIKLDKNEKNLYKSCNTTPKPHH